MPREFPSARRNWARSIRLNFPRIPRFKVKWNRRFSKIRFEKFGQPLKVAFFPEISCSIRHFYPVWTALVSLIDHFATTKATRWRRNDLPQFGPLNCLSSQAQIQDFEMRGWGVVNFCNNVIEYYFNIWGIGKKKKKKEGGSEKKGAENSPISPSLDPRLLTKTIGSDFLESCGLVVPNFLWVFARLA